MELLNWKTECIFESTHVIQLPVLFVYVVCVCVCVCVYLDTTE